MVLTATRARNDKEQPMRTENESPSVVIGVRLSLEKALTLQQLARANDRPPSTMARALLSKALEQAAAVPA